MSRQRSKQYSTAREKISSTKRYKLVEALAILDQVKNSKFDESVDLAVRLGVDPKQGDQQVRGACPLPHGLGKKVRVIVFAKGEKEKEAADAGADAVGSEELVKKVEDGWMDFDKVISTPDMMKVVSKLGRVLGPKGLMPNPKLGSVTFEIKKAVTEAKQGMAEYKLDKAAILHIAVGRASFGPEKLKENIQAVMGSILKAKPPAAKGIYLRSVGLSATMSPGIRLDLGDLQAIS